MMSRAIRRWVVCFLLLGCSTVLTADEELGDNSAYKIYLDIIGATFLGENSYFGESDSFIGANTDNWTEGAAELGIRGETSVAQGTFFWDASGLLTGTWGDDASGLTVGLDQTHEWDIEQAHIGWKLRLCRRLGSVAGGWHIRWW